MKTHLFALVILSALTSPAQAASNDGVVGTYARVEVGGSHFSAARSTTRLALDGHGQAAKVFIGYRFDTGLGLEAGYAALGSFSEGAAVGNVGGPPVLKGRSVLAAATGRWPVGESFALHGRLGLSSGRVFGVDRLPQADPLSGRTVSPLIGLGAEYRPRSNIALTLNYDNYGKLSGQVKASALLFGLHFTL